MYTNKNYSEGREEMYREMMQALAALESKYKGVRGELLKKVRVEFERVKPPSTGFARTAEPLKSSSPRCSACGREMKMNGTDGRLMCMNGHFG